MGQQVLFVARILRRDDVANVSWLEPPSFPGFRAEWLPARVSGEHESRGEVGYLVVEERRAIFPARAGVLEIPPARLLCAPEERPREPLPPQITRVPGLALRVAALPQSGRPADFRGVVGSLDIETHVEPRRVGLGETVRVSVRVWGDAGLWDVANPIGASPHGAALEVFTRRPELALEPGAKLRVRRSFAYDVVPRSEGELEIPGARIPYFDPARGVYAVAATPAVRVQVDPRTSRSVVEVGTDRAAPPTGSRGGASRVARTLAISLALTLLCVVSAGIAWQRAARRRWSAVARAAERARAARARGDSETDARELASALRAALALEFPEARALDAEELFERAAGDDDAEAAARRLLELERARFEPGFANPNAAAAESALRRLRPRAWWVPPLRDAARRIRSRRAAPDPGRPAAPAGPG
ncbi:MAG: BatD family protein [Deltaproteobacteria bacterium]|nr:MAG: BatD family protein [Deltaproteobacteria bacterium]